MGLLLAMALIAHSPAGASPSAPKWQGYGESESSLHFYDSATVRAEGNLRRVWRLFEFRVPADNGVRSGIALVEINCTDSTYRYLRTLYFGGTQGQGKYLGGSSEPQSDYIVPGSMIGRLARTVC